jgi:16S rRNA (guanine527-N7)-methyltransferase
MKNMPEVAKHLEHLCSKLTFEVSQKEQSLLIEYIQLLFKWNKAYNLTAVRNPQDMVTHHLMDCLILKPYFSCANLLDVGTGGGFPGIPLAILYQNMPMTLVDCNAKKVRFLTQAVHELGITCVQPVHGRVEVVNVNEKFEIITSRAFASLQDMVKLTAHLLSENGRFLAMKGVIPEQEIAELPTGYIVSNITPLHVPGLDAKRHLIEIRRA